MRQRRIPYPKLPWLWQVLFETGALLLLFCVIGGTRNRSVVIGPVQDCTFLCEWIWKGLVTRLYCQCLGFKETHQWLRRQYRKPSHQNEGRSRTWRGDEGQVQEERHLDLPMHLEAHRDVWVLGSRRMLLSVIFARKGLCCQGFFFWWETSSYLAQNRIQSSRVLESLQ